MKDLSNVVGLCIDGTQYVHLQSRLLVIEIFIFLLVDRVFNAADKVSRCQGYLSSKVE